MSHGARNWPFFTLTTLPVFAAATSRSVCRRKKRRDLQHIDSLRHARALRGVVHVREHWEFSACRGSRRRSAAPRRAQYRARSLPRFGWPCRTTSCTQGRRRLWPRSPSAPPPFPARAPCSPARKGRRSAPTATRCRSARHRPRRQRWVSGLIQNAHSLAGATMKRRRGAVNLYMAHDLIRKPVSTFRDHARAGSNTSTAPIASSAPITAGFPA